MTILQDRADGLTIRELAQKYKVGRDRMASILKSYGVSARRSRVSVEALVEAWVFGKDSCHSIGQRYGYTGQQIMNLVRKLGMDNNSRIVLRLDKMRARMDCQIERRISTDRKCDSAVKKFWSLVDVLGENECWRWKGRYGPYPMVYDYAQHRLVSATRTAWEMYRKEMVPSCLKVMCHTCDNPWCVNPHHLWPGTYKDNSQDMLYKGRGRRPQVFSNLRSNFLP